jgi:multidrug resistance efflux pump
LGLISDNELFYFKKLGNSLKVMDNTSHTSGKDAPLQHEPWEPQVSLGNSVNHSVSQSVVEAALPAEIARSWLVWQCQMVAGVIHGAIFSPETSEYPNKWLALWPEDGEQDPMLQIIADDVLEGSDVIRRSSERYGSGDLSTCDLIGCPLLSGNEVVGVVVLMISPRSESQQLAILQLLQWGSLWIEKLIGQRINYQQEFGSFTTNLISIALGQASCVEAASEIVDLLSDNFDCERVSLGLYNGVAIGLMALSHVERIDPRTQMVRRIEAAMEEASDQSATITEPADSAETKMITRAHKDLLAHEGCGASCTVLLEGRKGNIGALIFERPVESPFDAEFVANAGSVASLIGRLLEMKLRDERGLLHTVKEALEDFVADVTGPSYFKLKVFSACALLLVLVLSLFNGEHRVTAPASIEGAVRYMLVAPHEGFVEQANARAGDLVEEGQLVARLDDRGLQLELQKWQGELNKLQNVYQEALALRDRTKLGVTIAQIDQAKAEFELVEGQLGRTRLVSPIDGVIVRGDYSQALGAPVDTGQVLFEVAPLDSYQVVLEVDEFDVAGMQAGKSGQLIIAALPDATFAVSVQKVIPVTVSAEGRNYFRVEATLDEPTRLLRPGMEGVAKVTMGQRKLIWIWTHSLVDRLRVWFWSVGL